MRTLAFCAAAASTGIVLTAVAASCGTVIAGISFEEEIPAFRQAFDAWRIKGDLRGEWNDSGLVVNASERSGFTMEYSRYPGMKPFRGADEIVLGMKSDSQGKTTAELAILEFPSKKGAEPMKFSAPISDETRFKTELDPTKKYQIVSVSVRREQDDDTPWKATFSSLRGVFKTTKAEALHVEAETGNPLHIVREGQGERPLLAVHNAAQERIAAHGTLKVEGFSGDALDLPVDVAIDAGESIKIPVPVDTAKGVWKIRGEFAADDGSVASVDTRFAVMDFHGVTPKQPSGTFRLGVHWHFPRFTDGDRNLAASAMVACGAKLTRADVANMASIQPTGPNSWEFARTDEFLRELENDGIALDAIIFKVPRWAMTPPADTNTIWSARAVWPPAAGTFGTFCERLAARYGTRIDYYEIGNEWDLRFGGTYDEAVAVQREAYVGLKKGCPDACVIPNGWAAAGDIPSMDGKGRTWIHEHFLKNAKDFFDVDTIHSHGAFPRYINSISRKLFPLRERTGVADKPWFSNESALTSAKGERDAAIAVWKKILWAWAHGSVDYIWYNLRATGWDPKNPEHGYGLVTADFFPRETYVAFAALSSTVGGGEFRRAILDTDSRFVFEFRKGKNLVLAAWDESTSADIKVPVETDAKRAYRVDLMGNRSVLPLENGRTLLTIASVPSAIVLENATFASVDAGVVCTQSECDEARTIVIPPNVPGRAPDFVLEKPQQVHDFFEANPAERERLWQGPKDNSAKVWLVQDERGLRIHVEVEDDKHCEPHANAARNEGDCVEVTIADQNDNGQRRFCFAPTERIGTLTRYDALVPYDAASGFTAKRLEEGVRFNLIVNDSDSDRREAAIGIATESFLSGSTAAVPVIRFAKSSARLEIDYDAERGAIKPLHGVNNAPVRVNGKQGGQDEFKAAGIPFVRTHDTAYSFGGTHYVDIPNVFPNFDADETNPSNYDFAYTDAYLKPIVAAGCKLFYRLGVTIENNWRVKAYNIFPPKDYAKWARICEHVVRHYNEGWADGFRWNIEYWEIWNEPENPAMWQGTKEQFFDLYRVAANHLKTTFPQIKVGGYAGCGFYTVDDAKRREESAFYRSFVEWFEDFCRYVQAPETKAPLDFFSWHLYVSQEWPVDRIATHAAYVRKTLDAAGLNKTENIFNEWNIFRSDRKDQFETCKTHVGAANVAAAFCLMQNTSIDKAMYYDACPTRVYCGLFTFPGHRTTPCYEAFRAWNELAKLGTAYEVTCDEKGLYAAAAKNDKRRAFLVSNVGNEEKSISPNVVGGEFRIYRVDAEHAKLSDCGEWRTGALSIPSNGFVLALSGFSLGDAPAVDRAPSSPSNGLDGSSRSRVTGR
ncbi:MAG: hypothetical protein II840_13515 [Kiritimatiellae bacterium]|nr:hypothetical protein [Kiritimatiellia bacterium]